MSRYGNKLGLLVMSVIVGLFVYTTGVKADEKTAIPTAEQTINSPTSLAQTVPKPGEAGFAEYVMTQVDDLYRGTNSYGKMQMNVKTKHWSRSISMESWSLGQDFSLVKILKPKKEKGTATLKADKDLYIFLNKTGKTIKITAGMMGGSWMGSHFTNDDLVKESRLSDDYVISLDFAGEEEGINIYRFKLTPKPDAPVVWGKIEAVVIQKGLLPISQTFFDEDGAQVRKLTFSDYKELGGKMMPRRMLMKPLDGSDEFTEVIMSELDFTVKLKKEFFSIQRLRKK